MRLVRVSVLMLSLLFALPTAAHAGLSHDDGLVAVDEGLTGGGSDAPPEVPVVCSTSPITVSQNGRFAAGKYTYVYADARHFRFDPLTGAGWVKSVRTCRRGNDVVSSGVLWDLITDPDPALVASILRDRQEKEIAPPAPDLSPTGPGVVQLGMWLAVSGQTNYEVTASARPGSWVTARADLSQTMFDMGNGDVVTCAGAGDPIPPSKIDSVEQSPDCGYTYDQLNGGVPYSITITSTWDVSWTSSRGTSGTLPPIVKSTTVNYDVIEIQTVGGPADD